MSVAFQNNWLLILNNKKKKKIPKIFEIVCKTKNGFYSPLFKNKIKKILDENRLHFPGEPIL